MKEIQNFETEMGKLRDSVLNSIYGFFNQNPNEEIDVIETEGVSFELFNKSEVVKITLEGVFDSEDETQEFSNLSIEDLVYVIAVINDYIVDFNKAMKRASN